MRRRVVLEECRLRCSIALVVRPKACVRGERQVRWQPQELLVVRLRKEKRGAGLSLKKLLVGRGENVQPTDLK